LDELWKLIQKLSNKTNTGQKKKGRLAGRKGTSKGNGKLQIKMRKTTTKYVKRTTTDSVSISEVHDKEIMINLNFGSLM